MTINKFIIIFTAYLCSALAVSAVDFPGDDEGEGFSGPAASVLAGSKDDAPIELSDALPVDGAVSVPVAPELIELIIDQLDLKTLTVLAMTSPELFDLSRRRIFQVEEAFKARMAAVAQARYFDNRHLQEVGLVFLHNTQYMAANIEYHAVAKMDLPAKAPHLIERVLRVDLTAIPYQDEEDEPYRDQAIAAALGIKEMRYWNNGHVLMDQFQEHLGQSDPVLHTGWDNLRGLEVLHFSGIDFYGTPPAMLQGLGNLPLTTLSMVDCNLGDLRGLESLPLLTSLDVSQNHLTVVPEIEALHNLQYLDISANALTFEGLGDVAKVARLETLRLGENHVTILPPEFGGLSRMTYISFSPENRELDRDQVCQVLAPQIAADRFRIVFDNSIEGGNPRVTALPDVVLPGAAS